jgi:hypothetical protein
MASWGIRDEGDMMRTTQRREELEERILADPMRAVHWAEHCGFVPGSGFYPRGRTAACDDCFFRSMRDADARAVRRQRRRPPIR